MDVNGRQIQADMVEIPPDAFPRALNESVRTALSEPNVAVGIPVVGAVDFNGMSFAHGVMDPRGVTPDVYADYHQARHEQRLSLQYVKSSITFVLIYVMIDTTWKVWVTLTLDRFFHGKSSE
jgi:hypothetical protein|tara:strand:- start:1800 stop:2165 length:366 start_codon:yes stop_codon:yes gene_type:complete